MVELPNLLLKERESNFCASAGNPNEDDVGVGVEQRFKFFRLILFELVRWLSPVSSTLTTKWAQVKSNNKHQIKEDKAFNILSPEAAFASPTLAKFLLQEAFFVEAAKVFLNWFGDFGGLADDDEFPVAIFNHSAFHVMLV